MAYVRIKGHQCYYCGDVATTGDHFPPQTVEPAHGYILPCCMECNLAAGTQHPYDLAERVKHVKDWLRDRHWNQLKHYDTVVALHQRVEEWDPNAYFGTLSLPEEILEEPEPETEPEPKPLPKRAAAAQRAIPIICACGNKTFAPGPDGISCVDCTDREGEFRWPNRRMKTYTKNRRNLYKNGELKVPS